MLREAFDELLSRIREACLEQYGARLVSLAVFGSVARGTQHPDSDIDLLLVIADLPRGRLARIEEFAQIEDRIEPALKEASRRYGIHTALSPILKTPEELEAGSHLLLDMIDDARILVDRDGLLARRLERLAERLRTLNSRRIRKGGGYYWVLKPDLRPGETIEL